MNDLGQNLSNLITDLQPHTIVGGRYCILNTIAEGGTSIVYMAQDCHPTLGGRLVAIKEFFPPDIVARHAGNNTVFVTGSTESYEHSRAQFLREKELLGDLNSSSVLLYKDGFSENGTEYIVTEYLQGETLSDYLNGLDEKRYTDFEDTQYLFLHIANSVEYTHKHNIIHRDISPDNIFLTNTEVKLIDFGMAALVNMTADCLPCIKEGYTSPEQRINSPRLNVASDIYSLGATFYKTLTGNTPQCPEQTHGKYARQESPSPRQINANIPEWLDVLVMRCIDGDPRNRPTIEEIQQALIEQLKIKSIDAVVHEKKTLATAAWVSLSVCIILIFIVSAILLNTRLIKPCTVKVCVDNPSLIATEAGIREIAEDFKSIYPNVDVVIETPCPGVAYDIFEPDAANTNCASLHLLRASFSYADTYSVPVAYCPRLYYGNSSKALSAGATAAELSDKNTIESKYSTYITYDYKEFLDKNSPKFIFCGELSALVSIQSDLNGKYTFCVQNEPKLIRLSVSALLTGNQKKAAMKFLTYLCSERGQRKIDVIPANPAARSQYMQDNVEIAQALNYVEG